MQRHRVAEATQLCSGVKSTARPPCEPGSEPGWHRCLQGALRPTAGLLDEGGDVGGGVVAELLDPGILEELLCGGSFVLVLGKAAGNKVVEARGPLLRQGEFGRRPCGDDKYRAHRVDVREGGTALGQLDCGDAPLP